MIIKNKHRAKPKIWSVEMPNSPYSNRSIKIRTQYAIILT